MRTRELISLLIVLLVFALMTIPLRNAVIDDTYIHLQYARNLAEDGELAFNRGEPAYGATSPLWVIILAGAHRMGLDIVAWCHTLSWLFSGLAIVLLYSYIRKLGYGAAAALAGAAILSAEAWFVRWSAVGMETSFAVFMVLLVFMVSMDAEKSAGRSALFGLVLTLCVLTRPETVLLVPLSLLAFISTEKTRTGYSFVWLSVFILLYGTWLLIMKRHTGTYFPLTAGAKQGWALFSLTALKRVMVPLKIVGATLFLPSALFVVYLIKNIGGSREVLKEDLIEKRLILPALWVFSLPSVYLLLDFNILSRYILPLAPAIIILGIVSLQRLTLVLTREKSSRTIAVWIFTAAVLIQNIIFYSIVVVPPTRSFSRGVENVLVPIGEWLKDNTGTKALVAAPDIGAVGFYSERRILDLGGLITPEINRMRNSMELERIIGEGYFLKFSPDYLLDRDPQAERFAGRIIRGVRFSPVYSDTVSALGIRKPESVVYTLYRLDGS